jgi:photosystem II stability/assembly factor-like uncharacterized protein
MTFAVARTAGCAGFLLLGAVIDSRADAEPPVLSSEPARLASRALLIAVASAGERLVAVGDRGHILLSDDKGRTWVQSESVPTQVLLTGVCFADARRGIAVGHDEVILNTEDAGRTWKQTHYSPEAQQPLLDVWCGQGGRAIAVGAYSAYFSSEDGGATWNERKFEAPPVRTQPVQAGSADNIGGGFHLNRIVASSPSRLYIAAEAGHLYRSDDGGVDWVELPSPYEGSFFGVLPLAGDALLAFGLRGNLLRSEDAGLTWQRIRTGTVAMLDGGVTFGNDGAPSAVAIVGLSGVVLVSYDGAKSFALLQQDDRKGLSGVLAVGAGTLLTVGEGGAKLIALRADSVARGVRPAVVASGRTVVLGGDIPTAAGDVAATLSAKPVRAVSQAVRAIAGGVASAAIGVGHVSRESR